MQIYYIVQSKECQDEVKKFSTLEKAKQELNRMPYHYKDNYEIWKVGPEGIEDFVMDGRDIIKS